MWPTGMKPLGVEAAGRIPAEVSAEPGRCVGRLTDIGWGTTLRTLLAAGAPDEPVPGALLDAVVQVLAAWDWQQRPGAVVTVPSRTRPTLVGSLGQRIAAAGKLEYLGGLAYTGEGPLGRQHNSAQRLAALWHALAVPAEMRDRLVALGVPVLLVDDRVETGWTLTVAARLLRDSGAPAVLPLALATTT
jgi:ATP-dependent DNA helicase RecQ